MCQHTGWTWDYCEETLTMDRYNALLEYWNEHPPLQAMIAAYLGIESAKPKQNGDDLIKLLQSGQVPTLRF